MPRTLSHHDQSSSMQQSSQAISKQPLIVSSLCTRQKLGCPGQNGRRPRVHGEVLNANQMMGKAIYLRARGSGVSLYRQNRRCPEMIREGCPFHIPGNFISRVNRERRLHPWMNAANNDNYFHLQQLLLPSSRATNHSIFPPFREYAYHVVR